MIYVPAIDPVYLLFLLEQTSLDELGLVELILEYSGRVIDVSNVIVDMRYVIYSNKYYGVVVSSMKNEIATGVTVIRTSTMRQCNYIYKNAFNSEDGKYGGYQYVVDRIQDGVIRIIDID